MKKTFLALAALVMAAGAITFIACSKDSDKAEAQQASTKSTESTVIVGYSLPGSLEIVSRIDKENFLQWLEGYLNTDEPNRHVAEDLKMWNQPYAEGKYGAIMSVSYFDLKEEHSNTLYIKMDTVEMSEMVCYAVGPSSHKKYCGGPCKKSCKAKFDSMGYFLECLPCEDTKPTFFASPQDEHNWNMNHYCKTKEPSLGDLFDAIVAKLKGLFN